MSTYPSRTDRHWWKNKTHDETHSTRQSLACQVSTQRQTYTTHTLQPEHVVTQTLWMRFPRLATSIRMCTTTHTMISRLGTCKDAKSKQPSCYPRSFLLFLSLSLSTFSQPVRYLRFAFQQLLKELTCVHFHDSWHTSSSGPYG